VLASFTQLYRIGRDRKVSIIRIIIFDEAFSKMDSERIESSIKLPMWSALKRYSPQTAGAFWNT